MQTITVDMTPGFRQPTIHYSQNDVGTTFAIDLRSRFGDTLPASPTVKIQATKPSGFGFSIEADSVVGSVATFTTVDTMTDEAGRFQAELQIIKDAVVIYTANFYMEGEANPHPVGTTDGSQETIIPTLTLLVERVEAAAASVLDMTVNATTLAAGSQATYSYDEATNTATFGIPQGEAGAGAAGVTASAYSSSSTYAVGDYVIHNSNLYRCTTAITTAEAFTAAHWTQVVLGDDVSDLKSDINYALAPSTGNLIKSLDIDKVVSNNNGIATAPWTANGYVHAEFDVDGLQYISFNYEWFNTSFGLYVDDDGNVVGLIRDSRAGSSYVASVPSGATKAHISYNVNGNQVYTERGFVVLGGYIDLPKTKYYTIADYPYGKDMYYANNLFVEYPSKKLLDYINEEVSVFNIYYVEKDGSGDFTTIVDAVNYINDNNIMDATLYIGAGTWNLIDELGSAYVESVSSSKRGLYLKNRIHIICSSKALITCKYTGSRADTIEWLSAFNAGEHGFTLENANIETDNIRYSVHDEYGYSGSTPYSNKYINCRMKHTNGKYVNCIGGGLGIDGYIEIRGCYFEGDATVGNPRLVYYHANNERGITDAKGIIEVHDNYFAGLGTFGVHTYGDSEEVSIAYVSNNSLGSELVKTTGSYAPNDNIEMIAWNNEIRSA